MKTELSIDELDKAFENLGKAFEGLGKALEKTVFIKLLVKLCDWLAVRLETL